MHYSRWRAHGDVNVVKTTKGQLRSSKICALEGCERPAPGHTWCAMHGHRVKRFGDPGPVGRLIAADGEARRIDSNGYVVVSDYKGRKGGALEHRVVMMEHLGRELTRQEQVHHINGDRSDNRLENLELWSTSQPPGQRIADKVKWAQEILDQYKDDIENGRI